MHYTFLSQLTLQQLDSITDSSSFQPQAEPFSFLQLVKKGKGFLIQDYVQPNRRRNLYLSRLLFFSNRLEFLKSKFLTDFLTGHEACAHEVF